MSSVPGWLYIILVLFSGLFGVVTTLITTALRQSKRDRYEVFLQFMQHRSFITGQEFLGNLNKIFVVFRKDENVIRALLKFLDGITYENPGSEEMNRRLIKVYSEMCSNLNIKQLEDHVFLRPFSASSEKK